MNIREIKTPITAAMLNESLAKRYGSKIDVSKFSFVVIATLFYLINTRKYKGIFVGFSFRGVHPNCLTKMQLSVLLWSNKSPMGCFENLIDLIRS